MGVLKDFVLLSSKYDALMFGGIYVKNRSVFAYLDAVFMQEDNFPVEWNDKPKINYGEMEYWLCSDIRSFFELPIDQYLIESRVLMRRPW